MKLTATDRQALLKVLKFAPRMTREQLAKYAQIEAEKLKRAA